MESYAFRASWRLRYVLLSPSEATSPLAALSNPMPSSPSAEKLTTMDNKPNLSREVKLQWAGSRETISTPVEAEFFLDILFYRTHQLFYSHPMPF
jgi:hypothetical protein